MEKLIPLLETLLGSVCPECAKVVSATLENVHAQIAAEEAARHEAIVRAVETRLDVPGEVEAVLKGKP